MPQFVWIKNNSICIFCVYKLTFRVVVDNSKCGTKIVYKTVYATIFIDIFYLQAKLNWTNISLRRQTGRKYAIKMLFPLGSRNASTIWQMRCDNKFQAVVIMKCSQIHFESNYFELNIFEHTKSARSYATAQHFRNDVFTKKSIPFSAEIMNEISSINKSHYTWLFVDVTADDEKKYI